MTEKSLLSLREIAKELNVNYRTLIDVKNQFNEFIVAINEGRSGKYHPDYKDFFLLIYALKDEGYDSKNIKSLLRGEQDRVPDMDGWVEEWIVKIKQFPGRWTDGCTEGLMDGRISGCMDGWINGRRDGCMDGGVDGCMDGGMDGGVEHVKMDGGGDGRMDDNQTVDIPAITDQIIAETLANIAPTLSHIQNQIADLTATQTPDLLAQLNASLTQFYKFCQTIAERMDRLESELGIEHAEQMDLDLETLQVSQTQSYAYADLDFVRNSVSHGKPDKEAVRQWLVNERQINPAQSYATLAENLNQAGIPTLSGRDTWNRGTLRNLITER